MKSTSVLGRCLESSVKLPFHPETTAAKRQEGGIAERLNSHPDRNSGHIVKSTKAAAGVPRMRAMSLKEVEM